MKIWYCLVKDMALSHEDMALSHEDMVLSQEDMVLSHEDMVLSQEDIICECKTFYGLGGCTVLCSRGCAMEKSSG